MPEWNDYQKKILDECKKLLTAGKVYHYSLSMEELYGMKKVMIHLSGKVDIPLLWRLSFAIKNSSSCFFVGRQLLASCLMEIFSEKVQNSFDLKRLDSVKNFFFSSESKPMYPRINYNLLPQNIKNAAEKKDLATLTFLLDVSDDPQWDRSQLMAFFAKEKDFESISSLKLYDGLSTLKESQIFALLFHVDPRKYPELFIRLYRLADPEKFLVKTIACNCLPEFLPFLFEQRAITPDTLLFKSGPVNITLKQYRDFWCEIFPAAQHLQKNRDSFNKQLLDTGKMLSADELKPYFDDNAVSIEKTQMIPGK